MSVERISVSHMLKHIEKMQSASKLIVTELKLNKLVDGVDDITESSIHKYMDVIEEYIDIFRSYLRTTNALLQELYIHDDVEIKNIEYDYIKHYVYAKFDYASILQFADGCIRSLNLSEPEYKKFLNEYKYQCIGLAYKGAPESITVLITELDEFSKKNTGFITDMGETERQLFKSVKNYKELIVPSDHISLKMSISNIFHEVIHNFGTIADANQSDISQHSFIAHVFDYISYSVILYSYRSFIIGEYVYNAAEKLQYNGESVLFRLNESYADGYNVMNGVSYSDSINPKKLKSFKIGCVELMDNHMIKYSKHFGDMPNNPIMKTIKRTLMYKRFLSDPINRDDAIDMDVLDEHVTLFKSFIFTHEVDVHNGISDDTDINTINAAIIDYVNSGNMSINQIKNKIGNIFDVGTWIGSCIVDNITVIDMTLDDPTLSVGNIALLEKLKFINIEIYEEIMGVTASVMSRLFTIIHEDSQANMNTNLSIGNNKREIDSYDVINLSNIDNIIENACIDYDITNMYYDKLLSEYNMNEDASSKINFSKIIDNIMTMLKNSINNITMTIKGKQYQSAVAWIKSNREMMTSATFDSSASIEALPYAKDFKLPDGISSVPSRISSFNSNNLKDEETFKNFMKSLYPNDEVREMYANMNNTNATKAYSNKILFNSNTSDEIAAIKISGGELNNKVVEWMDNVESLSDIIDSFSTINDSFNSALSSFKSTVLSMDNKDSNESDDADDKSNNDAFNIPHKTVVGDVVASVTRLWSNVPQLMLKATLNQYGYLKNAYTFIDKNNNSDNDNNSDNSDGDTMLQ